MAKIAGGYYLKARQIQNSEIAHSPPHFREIWDWLLKEANHQDNKCHGKTLKRGQLLATYNDITDGLSWKIGYRKQSYTKSQCEKAMKFLRSRSMIETTKTTRGLIITIHNYDKYQNPKNYERDSEGDNESGGVRQRGATINKNDKNDKKEEYKDTIVSSPKSSPEKPKSPSQNGIPYQEIIDYLNQKTGRDFRSSTPKTKTLIQVLWHQGFRVEDFHRVIDNKTKDWITHPKYSKYLRPETLFGNKFEGYLNQTTNPLFGTVSETTMRTIDNLNSMELD